MKLTRLGFESILRNFTSLAKSKMTMTMKYCKLILQYFIVNVNRKIFSKMGVSIAQKNIEKKFNFFPFIEEKFVDKNHHFYLLGAKRERQCKRQLGAR